jgi:hypothetical protein
MKWTNELMARIYPTEILIKVTVIVLKWMHLETCAGVQDPIYTL